MTYPRQPDLTDNFFGRVEGSYYASPLSFKSVRAPFGAYSFRISLVFPTFPHVYIVVTTSVYGKEILAIPVVMITINMV